MEGTAHEKAFHAIPHLLFQHLESRHRRTAKFQASLGLIVRKKRIVGRGRIEERGKEREERTEEMEEERRRRGKGKSGLTISGPSMMFLARPLVYLGSTLVLQCCGPSRPSWGSAAQGGDEGLSVLPTVLQSRDLWPHDTPPCASAGHGVPSSALSRLLLTMDTGGLKDSVSHLIS